MFVCVDDNQGISKAQAESGCALPENKEARVRIEIVHLSALITSICALSREREQVCPSRLLAIRLPSFLLPIAWLPIREYTKRESRRRNRVMA